MTDLELEMAAKHYCKLMDLDPNEKMVYDGPKERGKPRPMALRWQTLTKHIYQVWAVNESIREAKK
jgi:hypothetical protein